MTLSRADVDSTQGTTKGLTATCTPPVRLVSQQCAQSSVIWRMLRDCSLFLVMGSSADWPNSVQSSRHTCTPANFEDRSQA